MRLCRYSHQYRLMLQGIAGPLISTITNGARLIAKPVHAGLRMNDRSSNVQTAAQTFAHGASLRSIGRASRHATKGEQDRKHLRSPSVARMCRHAHCALGSGTAHALRFLSKWLIHVSNRQLSCKQCGHSSLPQVADLDRPDSFC